MLSQGRLGSEELAHLMERLLDLVVLQTFLHESNQSVRFDVRRKWQTLRVLIPVTLQLHSGIAMTLRTRQ